MAAKPKISAADFLPVKLELPSLRDAAAACEGCELYGPATQTVFGEGPADAEAMFVGEQPGDTEDRAGRPFVGPAGQLLDELLHEAGVDRSRVYVTNAVKHFRFEKRGGRRIHARPLARHVNACRPWLTTEILLAKPKILVCLGATAAQSLYGKDFKVTQRRGEVFPTEWAAWSMATIHPSALLRIPEDADRERARADFIADMRQVAKAMGAG